MAKRGRFITLEGIEGVGKSTQAALLAAWLERQGLEVVQTREPGGAPAAESIRCLLKDSLPGAITSEAELLLIFAARAIHAELKLRPNLAAGRWVVCDRFVDASFAYQGAGRGLGDARIAALAEWLVPDLKPDLTLVLDLPLKEAAARLHGRGDGERDRFEREDTAFFRRVRDCYLSRAIEEPERVQVVDADGNPDKVGLRCRAILQSRFAEELTG
ncbi:MAG: dTMP kinase [Gammaproteobacteria bacterium]